jgi:hypothetical protein
LTHFNGFIDLLSRMQGLQADPLLTVMHASFVFDREKYPQGNTLLYS